MGRNLPDSCLHRFFQDKQPHYKSFPGGSDSKGSACNAGVLPNLPLELRGKAGGCARVTARLTGVPPQSNSPPGTVPGAGRARPARGRALGAEPSGPWNGERGCVQADLYTGSLTWNRASRILLGFE